MKLLKPKYVTLKTYVKSFDKNTGKQGYGTPTTRQILVSVLPFSISMVPDFQIDLARMKDHLILMGKDEISSDQSTTVTVNGKDYSVLSSNDTKAYDPRMGYFKTILKLRIDKAYQ